MTLIFPKTIAQSIALEEIESSFFDPDIIIPDDFSTIQEGINHADPGDKIFVRSGIYKENIIVNKSGLYLKGRNKLNTTIDGGKNSKDTVTISSSDITIQGFSIINGQKNGKGVRWDIAGINVTSSNVTIKDNLIKWNRLGINALDTAHNLTIINNSFIDDSILLGNYEYTELKFTKESFLHTIENNTVNGNPIYYYKNEDKLTIPDDAGQVILANCTNATIKDLYFTRANFPVILGFCSNCVIENLTVDNSWGEIILLYSNNCTIQNNTASNIIFGICLDYKSENNIIQYNKVTHNSAGIVVMTNSSKNKVYRNKIHDNGVGILLRDKSHDNTVYQNNIHDNSVGILLSDKSHDNNISKNKICNNEIGIKLNLAPSNNSICNNNFIRKCKFAAFSEGRSKNYWNHNYWKRPRILPKPIFAFKTIFRISIPYFIAGIDWHPARKPNDI
jgi:parallel beta-helix repeat protein